MRVGRAGGVLVWTCITRRHPAAQVRAERLGQRPARSKKIPEAGGCREGAAAAPTHLRHVGKKSHGHPRPPRRAARGQGRCLRAPGPEGQAGERPEAAPGRPPGEPLQLNKKSKNSIRGGRRGSGNYVWKRRHRHRPRKRISRRRHL